MDNTFVFMIVNKYLYECINYLNVYNFNSYYLLPNNDASNSHRYLIANKTKSLSQKLKKHHDCIILC